MKIEVANGFLVRSLELPRGLEWADSQLGANDMLSCGQFVRAWHLPNFSCSLLTGALCCGSLSTSTGGRKMMPEVLHHRRLYIGQSHELSQL